MPAWHNPRANTPQTAGEGTMEPSRAIQAWQKELQKQGGAEAKKKDPKWRVAGESDIYSLLKAYYESQTPAGGYVEDYMPDYGVILELFKECGVRIKGGECVVNYEGFVSFCKIIVEHEKERGGEGDGVWREDESDGFSEGPSQRRGGEPYYVSEVRTHDDPAP